MNRIVRIAYAVVAGAMLLTACAEERDSTYNEMEMASLKAWMEINRPELLDNYQQVGGYYVDVEKLGATDAKPISDDATWLRFTFTGRNLAGDIVQTRNEVDAKQVGTYTKFTHYVPYFKYYAGDLNASLIEGTYLALHNKLTLGKEYAEMKGFPREVQMRYGTKVTLYMPSTVVGTGGVSGSGGYEGQKGYELRAGYPFVVTMEITDTVRNPLQREGAEVDRFATDNGGLAPLIPKPKGAALRQPVLPTYAWENAVDSIPQVYVNTLFKPTTKFTYPKVYSSIYAPYSNFEKLEQDICDTLVNRFGEYTGIAMAQKDTVTVRGTAKIWYIGRLLDGFIFESNIPGVRRLIYGENSTKGEPFSYTPSMGKLPEAFYYTVPNLRYGQWAALLTVSNSAYGANGVSGTTNSSPNNNPDYYNYYNYMNSYYGMNGYYGGYYDNYYQDYLNGFYNNSNPGGAQQTTTSILTEIPPFTPVLFQFYIEPRQE